MLVTVTHSLPSVLFIKYLFVDFNCDGDSTEIDGCNEKRDKGGVLKSMLDTQLAHYIHQR